MTNTNILAFSIALIVTLIMTPAAIKIAPKIGAMDIPKDNRRMHTRAVPRFGGIAIYMGILVSVLYLLISDDTPVVMTTQIKGYLTGATLMVALGITDDLKNLEPRVKFAGQIICAVIPFIFNVRFCGFRNFILPLPLQAVITVLWIVGITNTINLIDGLDGLAAGVSAIAALCVAYTSNIMHKHEVSLIALAVAGACIAFLVYNSNPAKIFMGDAGSLLLGYSMATISLISDTPTKGTTMFAMVVPVITLALPIFDTAFAIIRRVANHRPIMSADKGHLHHRIIAMGFGQRRTVLALYCISAIMGVAGILWSIHLPLEAAILALIGMCLVTVFLGIGMIDKKIETPGTPPYNRSVETETIAATGETEQTVAAEKSGCKNPEE